MSDFTFLTAGQIVGSNQIDVIKKRGTKAAVTDFSILLGGRVGKDYCHIDSDDSLAGRTGYYWTKSDAGLWGDFAHKAHTVNTYGYIEKSDVYIRDGGARPALPFSSIDRIPTNGGSGKRARDGVLEVEYGYYPQKAVSKDMQERLERAYRSGSISRTRNCYTTDSRKHNEYGEKFKAQRHEEYEYKGKRYVRVEANFISDGGSKLSNGESYSNGDQVWVEVEPIKWLVSERDKLMLAGKIIFAGVQFKHERNYHTEDFGETDIKKFIDDCWARDIEQVRSKRKNYGNWY